MKLLTHFPHNARTIIPLESIWAVFNGMLLFYMPVYMREIGLSDLQIGLVSTVGLFVGCLMVFFAAPLTNKYGRRKTLLFFDCLSWGPSMLLWCLAQNVWFFVAAAVFSALGKIAYVAWACLLIEDSPAGTRAGIFATIGTIVSLSAVFTPLTALLFNRYQIIPTMRFLFILGDFCMMAMFVIRHLLVRETEAGQALMLRHQNTSVLQGLRGYLRTLPLLWRSREKALFALVYILSSYTLSFSVFTVIFLKEQLLFNETSMSLSPVITGLLNVLLVVALVPRLRAITELKTLGAAYLLSAAGIAALLLIPQKSLPVFILSILLTAGGSYLAAIFRDSSFMNSLGEHEKADAFSGVQTLAAVAAIPAGVIAGAVYGAEPRLLFLIIIGLHLTCFGLSCLLLHRRRQARPASFKAAE